MQMLLEVLNEYIIQFDYELCLAVLGNTRNQPTVSAFVLIQKPTKVSDDDTQVSELLTLINKQTNDLGVARRRERKNQNLWQ